MIDKMHPIFINKKIWKEFTEHELDVYVERVFNYYRKNGFPYFNMTDDKCVRVIDNLLGLDSLTLLEEGDILRQIMNGLNLANNFMPHMWETKCNSFTSPMETFKNDDMLRKAIWKRIRFGDNISDAAMRKALSWTHGTHRVSNFRPTIAKYIYDTYSNDGNVLDFSSGYGGRLIGAMVSNKVKSYTGTDPCLKTFNSLNELADFMSPHCDNKEIIIYDKPFEDLELKENHYDLSFSSPPYFNTEEYDYEDTQSFVRYPQQELWRDNFLKVVIENNYKALKDNGYFIINVADVKTYPELENDVLELSKQAGFTYVKTYKMALSKLMSDGYKYEPIFVFQKVNN